MDQILTRLRQRKLVQWTLGYAAGAFALIQVLDIVGQRFAWPDAAMRAVIVVLATGFSITVVLAWYHGERGAQRMGATEILILAVLLATGGLLLWQVLDPHGQAARAEPATATQAPAKSIAVLAFADLSPGHDQEYFADGMAEELLNALAKVKGLKVAGRSSSFSYKGKNEDLRTIGTALAVAHVLEGSVRKQGDKVRITAQLIRVQDGYHQWSESYDGDLQDVFALQERIARAIAEKLQVALSGEQAQQLVHAGTADPEAYALYLQASATFNRRDAVRYAEAMAQLEQATAIDPGFARAYARLAALYAVALNADTVDFDVAMGAIEKFAHRASQVDPSLAEPHAVLGLAFNNRREYRESNEAFARALALDPDDVTTNLWRALTLINSGYRSEGLAAMDRTLQLDPLLPNALVWRGRAHVANGELDLGERLLRRAAEGGHAFVGLALSKLEQARGNREAGISQLAAGLNYFTNAFPAGTADVFARASFGDAQAKARSLTLIDAYVAGKPSHIPGVVSYVLIHCGEPARAFALLQDRPTNNDSLVMGELFDPPLAAARRAPEFAEFVRRMGLAAYWDEAGPPDQCKKDANGDYHCD